MTHDEKLNRARRAKALLAQDDVRACFADVERDIFDHWRSLAWDEKAQAECLRSDQRALERLRGKLEQWAGYLAQHEQPR